MAGLKKIIKGIVEEATPTVQKKLERLSKVNPDIQGKTVVFNIRDTGTRFAVKCQGVTPVYTEDGSQIPDDAAVLHLTDQIAKRIITGRLSPAEARYRNRGKDGEPGLYITDVEYSLGAGKLSAPKQVVWLWCQSFFRLISQTVKEAVRKEISGQ